MHVGMVQKGSARAHWYAKVRMGDTVLIPTDVDKGQNHNLLDDRYGYDEDILTELQNIVLDKI